MSDAVVLLALGCAFFWGSHDLCGAAGRLYERCGSRRCARTWEDGVSKSPVAHAWLYTMRPVLVPPSASSPVVTCIFGIPLHGTFLWLQVRALCGEFISGALWRVRGTAP